MARRKAEIPEELTKPEWDRQPLERGEHYTLFSEYLRLGAKRSLALLVRSLGTPEGEFQREMNRLHNISSKQFWQYRKDKYEAHISKAALDDDIAARKEMIRRLAKHAQATETALMIPIQEFLKRIKNEPNTLEGVEIEDLFVMVKDAATKLPTVGDFERKLRGEPTEIIRQEGGTQNVNINANIDNIPHEELLKKAKELGFVRK